ncbi:2OG-Fe(II) oxygenase [Pseudomonas sp. PB120]|uniref:2OG-Fe(II) oxygenase n=1 Tax=Pseudomonas sp. PB120 TaxID=2494700 RepID=UPI0012FD2063|nr:2OG-Fe(II) oxygenase [Pseudomonas sp. PB120]MVV49168.1 2OG-Fe(II) oxygenase [Pseudomonas sp. PB120]
MKIEKIDNEIFIVDDFLTEEEERGINFNLKGAVWRYNWPNYEQLPFVRPCWHVFIAGKGRPERKSCAEELLSSESWSFLIGFWERFSKFHNFDITLLGVYANGQTFGQDTIIHRDNKTHPGLTVIVFCNEHWPTSWGGELVFYDDKKENIIKSVLPKARRVVIFDGRIPHAARSPSVKCDQVRMTLAFKTVIKG